MSIINWIRMTSVHRPMTTHPIRVLSLKYRMISSKMKTVITNSAIIIKVSHSITITNIQNIF
jgi:hypothetical protein